MKKIVIYIFLFILTLSNFNYTTAETFNYKGNLSEKNQINFIKQINPIFQKLIKKIENKDNNQIIDILTSIKIKIEKIQNEKKLSDKSAFILYYLNYLVDEKINTTETDDIDLKDILSINDENSQIKTETGIINTEVKNTIKCNEGYSNINGICTLKNENTSNISLNNQISIRKCYIENGEGQETYSNNSWGDCEVVLCNSNYHKEGNSCLSNKQGCNIDNGYGYKTWNGTWSNCNINDCNSGYESKEGKCLKICDLGTHREGDVCLSNKKSCYVENGKGEKEWKNGTWTYCRMTGCSDGYDLSINNKCEKIYINIKLINNKIPLSSDNNLILNLYIDTNLPPVKYDNICFIDKNNSNLISTVSFVKQDSSDTVWSRFNNDKICFRSPYYINSNYIIKLLPDFTSEDYGKNPILSIDKAFEIKNDASGEYYGVDKINLIEE